MKRKQSLQLGLLLSQLLVLPMLMIPKGPPEPNNDRSTVFRDNDGKRVVFALISQRVKERNLRLIPFPG